MPSSVGRRGKNLSQQQEEEEEEREKVENYTSLSLTAALAPWLKG